MFRKYLPIIVTISFLTILSIITQYALLDVIGDSFSHVVGHILGIVAGIIGIIAIQFIDLKSFEKPLNIIYFILLSLLIILAFHIPIISNLFVGNYNNANGWIELGPVSFQPVEFMKVALLLKLAFINSDFIRNNYNFRWLCQKYALFGLTPIILTFLQPDLGGALLLTFIVFIMFLFSLRSMKLFYQILISVIIFIILFLGLIFTDFGNDFLINTHILEPYQLQRFYAWTKPFLTQGDEGYQLSQSLIIIGSSGFWGHGISSQLINVPEIETDFIFAAITGLFGLLTSTLVIFSYFYIFHFCLKIGANSDDYFIKNVAIGIWALFFLQVVENIGMTIGVLPITGIVLPFLSSGKSAQITFYCAIGILLNIAKYDAKTKAEYNYK